MGNEEQVFEVLQTIKKLDPTISMKLTDEQILVYIEIAYAYVSTMDTIKPERMTLALALKTLSLATLPETSSLSKKKIKDVEMTYYQGQGRSKWDELFDSLVFGDDLSDKSLFYVGI